MTFDSADLATMAANGTLSYVILHEMGHALGLGQGIWSYDGLTTGITFTGAHAAFAYQLMGGSGNVPLEPAVDRARRVPTGRDPCSATN